MKKFASLAAAGRELAEQLHEYRRATDAVVVAVATGGVPVGAEVALQIQLPLELLMIRRLLVPDGAMKPICAVNVGGTLVLDESVATPSGHLSSGMDHAIADSLEQLAQRERVFRGGRAAMDVGRKHVILVDNGIHTGSTMLASIRALRRLGVASIVVAVPVADPNSRAAIERGADRFVCLAWPEKFGHAGMWYREFVRPTEQEIQQFFTSRNQELIDE